MTLALFRNKVRHGILSVLEIDYCSIETIGLTYWNGENDRGVSPMVYLGNISRHGDVSSREGLAVNLGQNAEAPRRMGGQRNTSTGKVDHWI